VLYGISLLHAMASAIPPSITDASTTPSTDTNNIDAPFRSGANIPFSSSANDAPLPSFIPHAEVVTMVADGVVDLLHTAFGNRILNHPRLVFATAAFLMVVGGIIYILYAYLSLDGPSLLLICGGIVIVVALKLRASLYSAPTGGSVQPSGLEMV